MSRPGALVLSDALPTSAPVLVVGATGDLGGRAVVALLARGKRVRALVREGSDASRLEAKGVEVVRGDLLDPASLDRALAGVDAVVTTAQGYMKRRRGDSLERTDGEGNRNLVDAAKRAGVRRFVFTSILTCDLAPDVPHLWQKKLTEDYLEASGVPFVSLRPGAFMGGGTGAFMARQLARGKWISFGPADVRITYIHPDEVARCLSLAVDDPRAAGRRVDLGSLPPASGREVAALFAGLLGRKVRVTSGGAVMVVFRIAALFSRSARDLFSMIRYFETGKYVADTGAQAELFGAPPKLEDAARKVLQEIGLAPRAP